MKKLIILLTGLALLTSCSNPYKQDLSRTAKSGSAQGRIQASQSGSESIFSDVD